MTPLGAEAPAFSLPEPSTGRTVTLDDVSGEEGLLVMFLSNHCPFVKHIADEVADFAREYQDKGFGIVGICANRPSLETRVTGEDLRAACDSLLAGDRPDEEQHPSVGCNIKWKAGNEPSWFG